MPVRAWLQANAPLLPQKGSLYYTRMMYCAIVWHNRRAHLCNVMGNTMRKGGTNPNAVHEPDLINIRHVLQNE